MATSKPQLPAFLQISAQDIQQKWIDVEWAARIRAAERERNRSRAPKPGDHDDWSRPSVIERNRYREIEPFIENRIRLKVAPGQEDYINASPIVLQSSKSGKERKWIATQGPRRPTAPHLWRMILDETGPMEHPATVIMLTQTHEAGMEKCFQYYPLDMSDPSMTMTEPDGSWTAKVELLSVENVPALKSEKRTIRMTLQDSGRADTPGPGQGHERQKLVYHYLYSAWPDFGVPESDDRAALIELVKASRTHGSGQTPGIRSDWSEIPRIVHCSAGVGRSGTFIALDYLLSELEAGCLDYVELRDKDVIAETVDKMRSQRMRMVQNPMQLKFLYDTIRERWLERHGQTP